MMNMDKHETEQELPKNYFLYFHDKIVKKLVIKHFGFCLKIMHIHQRDKKYILFYEQLYKMVKLAKHDNLGREFKPYVNYKIGFYRTVPSRILNLPLGTNSKILI